MRGNEPCLIVPGDGAGDIVVGSEGLSFWGGVDPETGVVIDAHHELRGQSLAGKIVLMPTSRGSCSGSGVLLQLALKGHAPTALVFREDEEILSLGAAIASRMFGKSIGVVRLPAKSYTDLSARKAARLHRNTLTASDLKIELRQSSAEDLELTSGDRAMLEGERGEATMLAMEIVCAIATAQGATRLIDISRGHIDGCIYAHEANLIFAEKMADMGAKVAVPTSINAISVDRDSWEDQELPPDFAQGACRLADAYVRMGARPTFTCAPYLSDDLPERGEAIGWSESNAVIFANSVLGARTAKHPDYFDLFVAMTGRAPETGVYLPENRRARMVLDVELPAGYDDALWPLLGWVAGRLSPDRVPLFRGLEAASPGRDDLRALCASFGTTSAAPLLHVAGVTPEGNLEPARGAEQARITLADLAEAWDQFNNGLEAIDLVALGSPHLSLEEARRFADLMSGEVRHPDTAVIVTLGRDVYAAARAEGVVRKLEAVGVQLIRDLCWCSIVEPVFPHATRTLMTNSGKYAHYAPGLSGREVRFGSLADCAAAAKTGLAPKANPAWLTP